MYFPRGFDLDRSMETGNLVVQAYDQYEASKKSSAWKLTKGYSLIRELIYQKSAEKIPSRGESVFDLDPGDSHPGRKRKVKDVPIGFIARRRKNVFLIFRGTSTDREWIRNFMINLVAYPLPDFGKVHSGFLQTYKLFRPIIEDALAGIPRGSRLFIAGHSLGGALATIAAPDIESRLKRKVRGLYTFGSPRIGDVAFVEAFNRRFASKSFRIVNTEDLVGSIPPPVPIAGRIGGYFSHVSTPVDFTTQGEGMESNHLMKTYLAALGDAKAKRGILGRLKFWYQ